MPLKEKAIQESSSLGLLIRNKRPNPEEIGKINKRDSNRKISDKRPSKRLKQEKSQSESLDGRETERCWNAAQRKYNEYSNNQNVLDHKNPSFWHSETFLSDDAPRKRISKAWRQET